MQAIYILAHCLFNFALSLFVHFIANMYILFLLIRSYILIHLAKKIDAMPSMTSFSQLSFPGWRTTIATVL